jgi:hypothetical protein
MGVDAPAHRVFRRVRGDCYDNAVRESFFSTVKANSPIALTASDARPVRFD